MNFGELLLREYTASIIHKLVARKGSTLPLGIRFTLSQSAALSAFLKPVSYTSRAEVELDRTDKKVWKKLDYKGEINCTRYLMAIIIIIMMPALWLCSSFISPLFASSCIAQYL